MSGYSVPLQECLGPGCLGGEVFFNLAAITGIGSGSVGAPGAGLAYRLLQLHASSQPDNTGIVELWGGASPDIPWAMTLSPGKSASVRIPEPGFQAGINHSLTVNFNSPAASQNVRLVMLLQIDVIT